MRPVPEPGTFTIPVLAQHDGQVAAEARKAVVASFLGLFPVEIVGFEPGPAPERVSVPPGMRCYSVTMRALAD